MSGDKIAYLNPLENFSENSQELLVSGRKISTNRPTFAFPVCEELLSKFEDQFRPFCQDLYGVNEETFRSGKYNGTIFRFPLRQNTEEIACISNNIYQDKDLKHLFHSFQHQAHQLLLFLKNIEKIELYEKSGNEEEPRLVASVEIDKEQLKKVRTKRELLKKKLSERHSLPTTEDIVCAYKLTTCMTSALSTNTHDNRHWFVMHHYVAKSDQSQKMAKLLHKNKTKFLPLVGICLPLDEEQTESGQVFCVLPIGVKCTTGLNVHVNGYFAMHQNRRQLKLPSSDENSKDESLTWNMTLVAESLPLAMVKFLKYVTGQSVKASVIYKLFPDSDISPWNQLTIPFYEIVNNSDARCLYTEAGSGHWVAVTDAYILSTLKTESEEIRNTLRSVLLLANITVCEPPETVVSRIINTKPLTVKFVLELVGNVIGSLSLNDKQNLVCFAQQKKKIQMLYNQALLETQLGKFVSVNKGGTHYFVMLEDFKEDLLPSGHEHLLVKRSEQNTSYNKSLTALAKPGENNTSLKYSTITTCLMNFLILSFLACKAQHSFLFVVF